MSKLIDKDEGILSQRNSFHISQFKTNINALIAVQTAIYEADMAIGVANKRWITLTFEGGSPWTSVNVAAFYHNTGAVDYIMVFGVPLPYIINGKNLVITDTRVTIGDSDSSDYLDRSRMFGMSGTATQTTLVDIDHNTVHGTGVGTFTYGHANQTIGGTYKRVLYYLNVFSTTANEFDFTTIEVEYYYA